jgi:glycosyltransferase involved in cell wall biosynthesis
MVTMANRRWDTERLDDGVPLVLHVVEAYGAGVAAAVSDYIASLPELRHVLLAYRRPGTQIADAASALFIELPAGRSAQMAAVRLAIRTLQPDVIHAHSSYAGAYVRLASPRRGARIVYSPHCYGFERRDLHGAARAALWMVEAALSWRTDSVGVVGEWEQALARRLSPSARTVLVPHRVHHRGVVAGPPREGPVVAVGRVEAQKDPEFFAAAAKEARLLGGRREWKWVGGGDATLEGVLRDNGVTVTGWQPRHAVTAELAAAHAYVHTAAWEGNPIALLEATKLGLPVIARDIPPLRHGGVRPLVQNPIELAQRVIELDDERSWRRAARAASQRARRFRPDDQAEALWQLYGLTRPDTAAS